MRSIVREVVTMDVNTSSTVILIGWRSWSFEELIEPLHFLKSKKNGIKQTEFSAQDPKTETLSPNQISLYLSLSSYKIARETTRSVFYDQCSSALSRFFFRIKLKTKTAQQSADWTSSLLTQCSLEGSLFTTAKWKRMCEVYVNSATAWNQNECVKKFPTNPDPRVARYLLTQQSNSAIRTRIPTKSFLILSSPFLVNSQPQSEVNVKRMRSTWILWILFHARAKWNVWNARQKKLLLSRARTHTTTTVTQSTRSWNAPLDCSRHTSAGIVLDADVPWCPLQ